MDLRGVGYADEDLLSLAAALPYDGGIEAVDLGENPRLTDSSTCLLLRTLASRHCDTLGQIRLDSCHGLGRETIALCTYFMQRDLAHVQVLDISGIQVPLQEYRKLAFAIRKHKNIREIRLADTGLGAFDKAQGHSVIANIMANQQLVALDIGWNPLDVMAFCTLGRGLVKHEQLRSLGLSNTGPKVDQAVGGSPVLAFLEFLERDGSLEYLDISNNGFDELAVLVLESAACRHPKLQHINFSQNALGSGGRRSLIRLYASLDCPNLVKLTATECRGGQREMIGKNPFVLDPSGNWILEMSQPPQRALMKLLLMRFSEGSNSLPPSKLMKSCMICHDDVEEVPYSPAQLKRKGEKQVWDVPTSGRLSFEFCAGGVLLEGLDESKDAAEVVHTIIQRTRLKLTGRRKTLAILSICKSEADERERDVVLDAISRDFLFTPEQVKALCHTEARRPNCAKDPAGTCCRLLPCLVGAFDVRQALLCTHNLGELLRVHTHGRKLLSLHLENPTGHYNFALSEPSDRATAERLLLLNRWEIQVRLASGRCDISQNQNLKNIRNEVYGNREFIWSAEEWGIFGEETLTFDYVSLRRPPEIAQAMSEERWASLLDAIRRSINENMEWSTEEASGKADTHQQQSRPTEGSRVLILETPSTRDTFPDGIGKEFTVRIDDLDNHRYQVFGYNTWLLKNDVQLIDHPSNVKQSAHAGWSSLLPAEYRNMLKTKGCKSVSRVHSSASALADQDVVWALRAVSSRLWLKCWQLRELLCAFARPCVRKDLLTYFCFRVVDWPVNSKMIRPKFSGSDWDELKKRLGHIAIFPFFQPENTFFSVRPWCP
jgi:hypothetical protein